MLNVTGAKCVMGNSRVELNLIYFVYLEFDHIHSLIVDVVCHDDIWWWPSSPADERDGLSWRILQSRWSFWSDLNIICVCACWTGQLCLSIYHNYNIKCTQSICGHWLFENIKYDQISLIWKLCLIKPQTDWPLISQVKIIRFLMCVWSHLFKSLSD